MASKGRGDSGRQALSERAHAQHSSFRVDSHIQPKQSEVSHEAIQ